MDTVTGGFLYVLNFKAQGMLWLHSQGSLKSTTFPLPNIKPYFVVKNPTKRMYFLEGCNGRILYPTEENLNAFQATTFAN